MVRAGDPDATILRLHVQVRVAMPHDPRIGACREGIGERACRRGGGRRRHRGGARASRSRVTRRPAARTAAAMRASRRAACHAGSCLSGAFASATAAVNAGNDLEHVTDDAVVGDLEDRRFLVLVDRDDRLRRAHAGEMLDRAARCRPRRTAAGSPGVPSGRSDRCADASRRRSRRASRRPPRCRTPSARSSTSLKFSAALSPRPPEMMTGASPRSIFPSRLR